MAPSVAIFYYHQGVGLSRLGRQDEAKKALLRARDMAPQDDSLQQAISSALTEL